MAVEASHEDLSEHYTSTGLPTAKVAMWVFLTSEAMLFGGLISTYLLYRGRSVVGPYPKDIFSIPYTSVSAFVLLASSLTMVLALNAIQRGDDNRFRIWILSTAMLGMVFIGGQIFEFTTFFHQGLTIHTNLFGSTFFTLTGFHGAHVTVGILMLLSLAWMNGQGRISQQNTLPVELVGLYWHFVDIVWIIIFTVVYLIPDASRSVH
jgi:cytochrome c oxidase subunit 3/cytochrome o ubiquinol oxidase subunit 3